VAGTHDDPRFADAPPPTLPGPLTARNRPAEPVTRVGALWSARLGCLRWAREAGGAALPDWGTVVKFGDWR